MTKLKKTYCILSLIFAIAVFVAVLFASQNRTTVYAASMDPDSIDSLDSETLFTIQRFFENNLNVSETSRGLFVPRNTLVYRLEKIKKLTGLDLRKFDDAIVFKVALMVKKYLSSDPARY